jgi:hypothetical protein
MTGPYPLDPIPDLGSENGTPHDDVDSCGSTSNP